MKFIKLILSAILAFILIASTGVFIFFQTVDTDKYLVPIAKKVSLALGRSVALGHMGVGISLRGVTLDLGPIIVMDDPAFTTQPFVKIDKIRMNVDLKEFLFKQKFYLSSVLLQSPEIHVIRNQDGLINIQSIVQLNRLKIENSGNVSGGSVKEVNILPLTSQSDPMIRVDYIRIQDAAFSYIDQDYKLPLDIWIKGINANLSHFSLLSPFDISLDASLLSRDPNVHLSTKVSMSMPELSVKMSNLRLLVNLSSIDMNELKGISPGFSNDTILKDISGLIELNLSQLNWGQSKNFSADGDLSITGGIIRNFNIVKTVLSNTLGVLGGMFGNIDNLLNGPLRDKLDAEDTVIEKAQAKFSVQDKTISIEDSLVKANVFEFSAKGTVDYGLNLDMDTTLHLDEDISAALVNSLNGLEFLTDDSKRIAIGASLKGAISHLKYKPNKDFRKKTKKALLKEGGSILNALFR